MTTKSPPFEALGRRIRQLRTELGWSQDRLAEILDGQLIGETATQAAVSQWEAGTYAPSSQKLVALAEAFDVELQELIRLRHGVEDSYGETRAEGVTAAGTPAGYDSRIAKLPEHVRRTIDDIIDTYEAERS